jgi:hypothetical protein
LEHIISKRARKKDLPTARRIVIETISKETKKNKNYDDPKQVRMNENTLNAQLASTDYLSIPHTHIHKH